MAEVFSVPRICKLAEKVGLSCGGSFDILSGWDLSSSEKRAQLREKLSVMKPRLLLLSPPCETVASLQGLKKHVDMKRWLERVKEGKIFLRFSMQLALDQIARGDLFVLEQPHSAKSWNDPAVKGVETQTNVRQIIVDQCMFGLTDRENGRPHRKRTRLMVNSEHIAQRMAVLCDNTHVHQHILGSVKTQEGWKPRSKLAQEYPQKFCREILRGLLDDIQERQQGHAVHCVLTIEAFDTKDEQKIIALLRRCHENLGHPSTPRFIAMLKAARANDTCIRLAKGLNCSTCRHLQGEQSHNVSKAVRDLQFNELLCVDTFEVELPRRKLKLLNIVDIATRYQLCVPLWKGIEIKHVRKAYRRYWKRWAGAPKTLISDGGPEFGACWTDHLSNDGTEHSVTAAYAPWQNGVCERLRGAWKIAFQKALMELDPQTKEETEELCDQLNLAHNTLTRHDGYSPQQHVLGTDVRIPLLGMVGEGNETLDSALQENEERHVRSQKIRLAARKAFLDADSEDRLRRAVRHRTRLNRGPFVVGDQVLIWRRAPNEKKHHWHGPGRVIGAQSDKVWVMYGAKVYRCAPEQVKHVDNEIVELASWLPITLRSWRSTIRERGAGNVVELDKDRLPPADQREVREMAEREVSEDQGPQGSQEDIEMRHEQEEGQEGDNQPVEPAETSDQARVVQDESESNAEVGHVTSSQRSNGEVMSVNGEPHSEPSANDNHDTQAHEEAGMQVDPSQWGH